MFKQSNKKVRVRDDLLFVRKCSGLKLLPSILRREKLLSRRHPKTDFYYLWFLGVHPENQGKGYGSRLLEELCQLARKDSLPLYLETSSEKNIAFYRKNGLELYDKLTFDFDLYLFKMEG
ncbi:MAG: GNAT family N-acetyltransferase, partial [Spirochaetales bacterium]|nr:GNAT family N-acetyltransferase [Spirochaetales bacterium]